MRRLQPYYNPSTQRVYEKSPFAEALRETFGVTNLRPYQREGVDASCKAIRKYVWRIW